MKDGNESGVVEQTDFIRDHRSNRPFELLCLGSGLGIAGLLFSLMMLTYRSNCDVTFHMGKSVERNGVSQMCKTSHTGEILNISRFLEHNAYDAINGQVIIMPGTSCHNSADCSSFDGGRAFCIRTEHRLITKDYCKENACSCHTIVYDCGVLHHFEISFRPSEFVQNCTEAKCKEEQVVQIPLFKRYRSGLLGCEHQQPTIFLDAMLLIQGKCEVLGILRPLIETDADAWAPFKQLVRSIPKVEFGHFWPSTISESVSSGVSPEAKMFIGFMLCASLCLFLSEYVVHIKTVDMPMAVVPVVGIRWNAMRRLLPPIGLVLLSFVQMVPTSNIFGLNDVLMTATHLVGAQFVFVVYLICEGKCLVNKENRSEMKQTEFLARLVIVIVGGIAMATFATVYGILLCFCGGDETPYVLPPFTGTSDMFYRDAAYGISVLVRPAEGGWKALKMVSYIAEYIVAMSMLVSHAVICYFFRESLHFVERAGQSGGVRGVEGEKILNNSSVSASDASSSGTASWSDSESQGVERSALLQWRQGED